MKRTITILSVLGALALSPAMADAARLGPDHQRLLTCDAPFGSVTEARFTVHGKPLHLVHSESDEAHDIDGNPVPGSTHFEWALFERKTPRGMARISVTNMTNSSEVGPVRRNVGNGGRVRVRFQRGC